MLSPRPGGAGLTLRSFRMPRLANLAGLVLPCLTLTLPLPLPLLLRLALPRLTGARTALRARVLHPAKRPANRAGSGAMAKRGAGAGAGGKPARRTRRRQECL